MQRVEKHIFTNDKQLTHLCWLSKNLYNYANYIVRQVFTENLENIPQFADLVKTVESKNGKIYQTISEYDLTTRLAKIKQIDYIVLPAQVNQQVIKVLYKNWLSFYKSSNEYFVNPSKFTGRPKLPKYKDKSGQNIFIMSGQIAKLKDGFIKFPSKTGLKPLKTLVDNVKQVRIVPQATCHVVEVVYEKQTKDEQTDENLYLSIDLGINNLATCVTNVGGLPPFIVNGKIVKSINQYYNKTKAKLMSILATTNDTKDKKTSNRINRLTHRRNCKIDDYMHKSSRFIIDYCVEHEIGNIVVGYNVGWKDEVKLGRTKETQQENNQKFVSIPFDKLVRQIEYKAEEVGISVQRQEESYTSKCDAFALETIEYHKKYSGKRVKRGLFKSSVDRFVNSDVNGAINILRKVIGDGFVKNIADRGILDMPLVVNVS